MILPFILQPQSSTAPPAEQDSDFDPVRVGMGVALGFLVAIIIAVTVAVMVIQRRRKRNAACSIQPSQGDRFTNAIYTGMSITAKQHYGYSDYSNSKCLSM